MSIGIGLGTGISNFPMSGASSPDYDALIANLMTKTNRGLWFDATDMSTMFQDISGLTPVTGLEQSIGLWLDKSKGLALGNQFVTNADFSQGETNWTLGTGWAIADSKATKTPGEVGTLTSTHAIATDRWYKAKITVTNRTAGSITVKTSAITSTAMSANGTFELYFFGGTSFYIEANATFDGSITLFEVRESYGHHVMNPTSKTSYKPKLSRRYNLLVYTRSWTFVSDGWVREQTNYLASQPDPFGGTTAITLRPNQGLAGNVSYAKALYFDNVEQQTTSRFYQLIDIRTGVTGKTYTYGWSYVSSTPIGETGWYQIEVRSANMIVRIKVKPEAWDAIGLGFDYTKLSIYNAKTKDDFGTSPSSTTSSMSICEPEVLLGQINCADVPYQWVETATNYDTDDEKFPLFVTAQNDTLVLPFTPTGYNAYDKVTAACGLSRMSSQYQYCMIEHGPTVASTSGTWLLSPFNTSGNYAFTSRGTTQREAVINSPTSQYRDGVIVIGRGHISGDVSAVRTNKTAEVQVNTDQGSGAYANLAFNVFSRAGSGTTLPTKARCYGIIVFYGAFELVNFDDIMNYFKAKMRNMLSE